MTALATSWAPLSGDDALWGEHAPTADRYLDALLQLGARALLLVAGPTVPVDLPALTTAIVARGGDLPVVAVDGVLGALRLGRPRSWRARACSLDRSEAQAAVEVARAAMDLAAELRAPAVVVGLGAIGDRGDGIDRLWRRLRGKLARGVLAYDDSAAEELRAIRGALGTRHFDAALRSLDQMVEDAARRGVRVLLRNPARGLELPAAIELSGLRAALRGAPLAPLLDLPAAHLASMLRLQSLRDTVLAFGDCGPDSDGGSDPVEDAAGAGEAADPDRGERGRGVGCLANLSDGCGVLAGLVPGQGEIEVEAVARMLPGLCGRLFVPWARLTADEVRAGYAAVDRL